ncbi:MAG: hypothetical protein HC871_17500, partial [Rhizobiales bacterium]|nr:hypothetical protein [Hyphomicrobiales bacterium]
GSAGGLAYFLGSFGLWHLFGKGAGPERHVWGALARVLAVSRLKAAALRASSG